jgi:NADPH:quinone reductase
VTVQSVVHAIVLHAFGPAENLVYEEVPDPAPTADEVRIAVEASGVHLIDTTLRRGVQMGPLPLAKLPAIPGREAAGTVDAIGHGVDDRWLGRRVVAHLGAASADTRSSPWRQSARGMSCLTT